MDTKAIPDYINEHLRATHKMRDIAGRESRWQDQAPRIHCADGFNLSVQASETHYSSPRENGAYPYHLVEVGYPSGEIPEIMEWCEDPAKPTDTVYGYVPTNIVNEVIHAHGGITKVTTPNT